MNGSLDFDPDDHRDLFRVTDDLYSLEEKPRDLTRKQYAAILEKVCNSFKRSLAHGLGDAVYALRDVMDPVQKSAAREILAKTSHFSEMLKFDEKALIACGATKAMARDTIRHVEAMRSAISKDADSIDFNPELLVAAIKKATTEVCTASTQVEEGLTKEQVRHEFRQKALFGVGSVLLLSTAVVLTGGAAVPAMAVSPAYLTASGLVGGWFLTISGRLKDPLGRAAMGKMPPKHK
jgi:hypothetical protein